MDMEISSERALTREGLCAVGARRLWILALALSLDAAAAWAADERTAWAANDISVIQTVSGQQGNASTRFEIGENGDARVAVSLRDGAMQTDGTILLIAGRWMLTRGFPPTPGIEIKAMNIAALNSQLVMVLLTAAMPRGPPAPGSPQHVIFSEKNNPIRIATATATAEYGPPWRVEGTVTVSAAAAPATYRLAFTFAAQGHPATRIFAGSVSNSSSPVHLPDAMRLHGWTIRRIGEQVSDSPKLDEGARPLAPKATTIGELRELE
jgi:hypothetical protein